MKRWNLLLHIVTMVSTDFSRSYDTGKGTPTSVQFQESAVLLKAPRDGHAVGKCTGIGHSQYARTLVRYFTSLGTNRHLGLIGLVLEDFERDC